jgi:hypothetical protein
MTRIWFVLLFVAEGCAAAVAWDPQHPTPQGPPSPALKSPAASDRVTNSRPHFSWRLPAGEKSAVVEVCRDAACNRVVAKGEAAREWTPDQDLPSGMVYWRAFGKDGDLVGKQASETRPLAVDTSVSWTGKHVEVIVPLSASRFGEQLAPRLDRAVELYAKVLGVAVPPASIPVLFYTTDEAYERAHARSAPIAHEAGFAFFPRQDSSGAPIVGGPRLGCHVKFGAQDGIGDDPDATGVIEEVALHELAHAVEFLAVPRYMDLPAWWTEGLSDLLACRAMREILGVPLERQRLLSSRVRLVDALARSGKLVPLTELVNFESGKPHTLDPVRMFALYAESFYLLHFLEAEQPERFAATLRAVANMTALRGATSQLRDLTGDLDSFQKRWLAAVGGEHLASWQPLSERSDVRTTPAELVLNAPPGIIGAAAYSGPSVTLASSPRVGDAIEAVVDVHAGDEPVGCLLVAGARANYVACANNRNARLLRLRVPQSDTLASANIPAGAMATGTQHKLALEIGAERWTLRLDDEVVLEAAPPREELRAWGVAAVSGRSHYRGAHLRKAP